MGSVANVVGLLILAPICVIVLGAVAIYLVSEARLNQRLDAPADPILIAQLHSDAESFGR